MRRLATAALLALLPALSACGDLPHPFQNNPGRTAMRLSRPPPPRLLVPPPGDALLDDGAADTWSGAVADALVNAEVPAVVGAAHRGEWRLVLGASLEGDKVVPRFALRDAAGREKGGMATAPVPAAAWADGDPALLRSVAANMVPGIAAMLDGLEAAHERADPNSLLNRPARVAVTGVSGAPGDGDAALARQLRAALRQGGTLLAEAGSADYAVRAEIKLAPGANGSQRVEIQWIVTDALGQEDGRVVQLNEVPRGSLDLYWGETARAAAQQAAGGIRDVMANQLAAHRNPRPRTPAGGSKPQAGTAPRFPAP